MQRHAPDFKENYPLRDITTFGIGGPARYFAVARGVEQVGAAFAFAQERRIPVLVIGGGSNVLVSDEGFPGLVILNRIAGVESRIEGGSVFVTAGAGEDWDGFVQKCVASSWQGLECLSGIPGTVGASPVQNVGAYGQSVDSSISEVRAFDTRSGGIVTFGNRECGFAYRKSIFNALCAGRYIITGVTFRLTPDGVPQPEYHDIRELLSGDAGITPAGVRNAVLEIRNRKGLLILEGYESFRSAGSFFKNAVVSGERFEKVKKIIEGEQTCTNWAWPLSSGDVKISAACLIQSAGFRRGHREGNVGLSPMHALVIVNYGGAAAAEVVAFARCIQEEVNRKFGVVIEPEVQLVGFPPQGLFL